MPQVRSRAKHLHAVILAAGVGVLPAALGLPVAASTVKLPRAGVICDTTTLTCYTGEGPSLSETRSEFGRRAEQNLVSRLSGRPPAREFSLSGGELCDLRQRTCWDDGSKRRNVSNRLTRQLWGEAASGDRRCQLSQRGRNLFDGRCRLTRRDLGNGTGYQVETSDGRRYNFFANRDGRLVLRDATGLWPVTTSTLGNRVEFRWADLRLETFRRQGEMGYSNVREADNDANLDGSGSGQSYRGVPTGIPASPGQALDTILKGLFQ
ncbi:hypothetical protein NZK33_11000 [Cyanobium sp. FGCU-6]|jgi:hypothetical protein|nr:hypothetical protein [Cyanobium sp. FGCU6]